MDKSYQTIIDGRVSRGEPGRLTNMDLGVIINGRNATNSHCYLPSPWEIAFSLENNLKAWDKCGACPLNNNVAKKKSAATVVLDGVEETNSEAIDPTSWVLQIYIE